MGTISQFKRSLELSSKAGKIDDSVALNVAIEKANKGAYLNEMLYVSIDELLNGGEISSADDVVIFTKRKRRPLKSLLLIERAAAFYNTCTDSHHLERSESFEGMSYRPLRCEICRFFTVRRTIQHAITENFNTWIYRF